MVALAAMALLGLAAGPPVAAGPRDYDVANGHYYEQGTHPEFPAGGGFVVLDDEAAPLWGEFRRLGGVRALGLPISNRYDCDGAICQAFRHAVLIWSPGSDEAALLDIFDRLHALGHDEWLDQAWGIPPLEPAEVESPPDGDPLTLLDLNEPLKSAYWRLGPRAPDVYGLPRAYRASDTAAVLRTQRAVLMQSLTSPGQVGLLPAGQVVRDAGYVPRDALVPIAAPAPLDASPPTRVSMPSVGIDAAVISLDMGDDGTLPTPDDGQAIAWYSYGARLGESGNAILAGHVDWAGRPGVFWRLREVQPGQLISLHGGAGQAYTYQVAWARDFPAESLAGLAALRPRSDGAVLTLVTCSGRFDFATRSYESRRVVRAVLVP